MALPLPESLGSESEDKTVRVGTDESMKNITMTDSDDGEPVHFPASGTGRGSKDLRGQNLSYREFYQHPEVIDVNLRHCQLVCTDLSSCTKLTLSQIGGTDLRQAKLPEHIQIALNSQMEYLRELNKKIGTMDTVLIASLIVMLLLVFAMDDIALLTNMGTISVPLVNVALPPMGFVYIAPLFAVVLFLYLHFHILQYWQTLADMPAIFPDGTPLTRKGTAWLGTSWLVRYFPRLQEGEQKISLISAGASLLIIVLHFFTPLVLIAFSWRCLVLHSWITTGWHILLIWICFTLSIHFLNSAERICHDENITIYSSAKESMTEQYLNKVKHKIPPVQPIFMSILCLVLLSIFALQGINGIFGSERSANFVKRDISTRDPKWKDPGDYEPMPSMLDSPTLVKPERVQKIAILKANSEIDASIAQIRGGDLHDRNLSRINGGGLFLVEANLRGANLRHADLHDAQLRSAKLADAQLDGAQLYFANMQKVDCYNSRINDKANFLGANIRYGIFNGAQLRDAQFLGVHAQNTEFRNAHMENADLTAGNFDNANFVDATLTGITAGSTIKKQHLKCLNGDVIFCSMNVADQVSDWRDGVSYAIVSQGEPSLVIRRESSDVKVVLNQAFFRQSIFVRTHMEKAKLSNCYFDFPIFRKSFLNNATLVKCDFWHTNFSECDLSGVTFTKCIFSAGSLSGCVTYNTKFIDCEFRDFSFASQKMTGIEITQSQEAYNSACKDSYFFLPTPHILLPSRHVPIFVPNISFADAVFEAGFRFMQFGYKEVDFSNATMTKAYFYSNSVPGSKFIQAHLENATLLWTDFSNCDFRSARLEGAVVIGSTFTGAHNLESANLDGLCFNDDTRWSDPIGDSPFAIPKNISKLYEAIPLTNAEKAKVPVDQKYLATARKLRRRTPATNTQSTRIDMSN